MQGSSACRRQAQPPPLQGRSGFHPGPRKGQPGWGGPGRLRVLFALAFWVSSCKGAPMASNVLQGEQDLQLWNEIDDVCSAYLARDAQPQSSNALEELCFMVLGLLQKNQALDEKDNTKRFLFHYSKAHDTGSSDLLEELRIPGGVQSRGYFIFRDPNEDTEWNDVLRNFGILPPKEEVKDEIEEMVLRLQKEAEVKPYERMNLEQLKEAEDDFDEEDMKAVEMYRKQRMKELKSLQKRQKYGELREIAGEQYVKEVTNAPKDVWVVIHLYQSSIPMCSLINTHLSLLAKKFPETKFVKAVAKSCIENYHDRCLPTLFVYENGQIKGKFLGITECGGTKLTAEELEWKLAEVGALKTDLEENPKKGIVDMMTSSIRNASIHD